MVVKVDIHYMWHVLILLILTLFCQVATFACVVNHWRVCTCTKSLVSTVVMAAMMMIMIGMMIHPLTLFRDVAAFGSFDNHWSMFCTCTDRYFDIDNNNNDHDHHEYDDEHGDGDGERPMPETPRFITVFTMNVLLKSCIINSHADLMQAILMFNILFEIFHSALSEHHF